MAEKNLQNPPELERLYALRKRLAGTDRDDHLQEIDQWEVRIKKALIALNLLGHEGITMLLDKAREEVREIHAVLKSTRPVNLSAEGAQQYAYEAARLHDKKEMWIWFMGFFDDATNEVNQAVAFLDEQDLDIPEDDWKGKSSPQDDL